MLLDIKLSILNTSGKDGRWRIGVIWTISVWKGEVGKLKEAGFLGLVSQEEKEEGIVLLSQVEAKSWVDGQSQQGAGEHRTQSYFVLNWPQPPPSEPENKTDFLWTPV